MLTIAFTGKIFSVETDTIERNGEEVATTALKFSITQKVKERDKNSENYNQYVNKSIWCRTIAYGKTAEYWANNLKKGDPIAGTGTFEVDPYLRKESNKPDYSLDIRGHSSVTPTLQKIWVDTEEETKGDKIQPKTYGKKARDDSDDDGFFKG